MLSRKPRPGPGLSAVLGALRCFRPEEICFLLYWAIGLSLWLVFVRADYRFNVQWGVDLIPLFALPFVAGAALRGRMAGAVSAARDWFGIYSASVTYLALHGMVILVNPRPADETLLALDRVLLGGDPSMRLQGLITPRLTLVMVYFYTLYALYPTALLGILYAQGARARPVFHRASLALVMTLFLGYLGYVLVPARGPMFTLASAYTVPLRTSDASHEAARLVDVYRYAWDCFPSLHTACSFLVLLYAYEYSSTLGTTFLVPVLLTIFSCVYLRYHYGIDIIAGLALAFLTRRAAGPIRDWWDAPGDASPRSPG